MDADTPFEHDLAALGFRPAGSSRRGRTWMLAANRHLTFSVHLEGDDAPVVLSWVFGLGEYIEEQGWRLSVTDTSTAELYPQHDVHIPPEADAVRGEIARVRQVLRLDFGADEL